MPCDCTFMGGNNGGCPLPPNSTFQALASSLTAIAGLMTHCHTLERDNPHPDCLPSRSLWETIVQARMQIEIYP